jgi:Cys-Gly metallodipeptidase DUG1
MAEWLNAHLKAVGVATQLVDLGKHTMDGEELHLPPAILGRIGDDKGKKTVLVYGHFDVQPVSVNALSIFYLWYTKYLQASKSDGWNTDPFTLTIDESTGQLIGRGSSDDKGPVLGWLNVLQYHYQQGKELPVNLRCCFEGMEESGSEGLDELVQRESKPGGWFDGVDCVCIVRSLSFSFLCVHADLNGWDSRTIIG